MKKTDWFTNARFGMFIHWGIYSIPAKGEWSYAHDSWEPGVYEDFARQFIPIHFAPRQWAKLAKDAGMKYVVFTTKHHDGFCMIDSHYTDYKITNTPYKKDVTKMLADAFREEGLKVGFYHSLPDWTHPGYADPESPENYHRHTVHTPTPEQRKSFLDYLYNNVKQLMTEYGKVDLLFFDYTSKYKDGQDYFDRERLLKMVYECQPEIIVNDRLAYSKDGVRDFDYYTPEVTVMNHAPNVKGKPVVWESCTTMNDNWGYFEGDDNYKAATTLTAGLIGCTSQNGNLLLNVGPMANGRLPSKTVQTLEELAKWYGVNGEAVYGCGKSDFHPPFGFTYTQKENILYMYTLVPPMGDVILPELNGRIESITHLRTGENVRIIDFWGFELLDKSELRIRPVKLHVGDVLKIVLKKEL